MRHPEEIPKAYRRKGIRQKRTKEDRRHEEKTAGGRKLSSPKARYYHSKTGEETRLRVDPDQDFFLGGVRQAFGMKKIQINR